jgi:hypothetical protein
MLRVENAGKILVLLCSLGTRPSLLQPTEYALYALILADAADRKVEVAHLCAATTLRRAKGNEGNMST